jgi:hypothetical protein
MATLPGIPEAVKVSIREKTASHEVYRNYANPLQPVDTSVASAKVDLSWKKGWTESAELLLQLVEGVAFDVEFDPSLKNGVNNRKAYPEMLDYAQIKD